MEDFIKELDRICQLDTNVMTEEDIAFIKARESYLTDSQREKVGELLKNSREPDPYQTIKYQDLMVLAKERGITVAPKIKKPDLIILLNNFDQENKSDQ